MRNSISFTSKVKEEIVSNEYPSMDRLRALLSGYIRVNGTILLRSKKTILILKSENAKIAKFIYENLSKLFKLDINLLYSSKGNMKKTTYTISIDDGASSLLEELDVSFLEGKVSKKMVYNDDTISGYLAGCFLSGGSINSPYTTNYHLELALNSENHAKWVAKLFARYKNSNIEPKVTKRREKYIVYFKKSDQIANFMIMTGAVVSCMEYENIRVDRDFANTANRLTNSDTANMKKTYETATRQIEEIELIEKKFGIKNISNVKARELCELRLANETATLNDLANLLSEKINSPVSKSNIAHLFRFIHNLYLRLAKDDHQ